MIIFLGLPINYFQLGLSMFKQVVFTSFFLLFIVPDFYAQDTLILIDRPYKIIDVVELNDSMLVYAKPGKRRLKYIERDKAYSIRGTNKEEQIIYIIDTLEGNYVSAWDMKYYIEGQLDALHGYKGKANKIAASGVVFGASGSVLGLFYGPIAPTLYIIFQSTKKVRAKPKHNFNADKVQDDMYVLGYNTMARRMTMKKLYWSTLSGYAIGLVTYTILFGGK
jgi:hypothetical protein